MLLNLGRHIHYDLADQSGARIRETLSSWGRSGRCPTGERGHVGTRPTSGSVRPSRQERGGGSEQRARLSGHRRRRAAHLCTAVVKSARRNRTGHRCERASEGHAGERLRCSCASDVLPVRSGPVSRSAGSCGRGALDLGVWSELHDASSGPLRQD